MMSLTCCHSHDVTHSPRDVSHVSHVSCSLVGCVVGVLLVCARVVVGMRVSCCWYARELLAPPAHSGLEGTWWHAM